MDYHADPFTDSTCTDIFSILTVHYSIDIGYPITTIECTDRIREAWKISLWKYTILSHII
jgi:hypothetical protein